MSQDGYRLTANGNSQPKHEEYSSCTTADTLSTSNNNQFLSMSECNPLFSQERLFTTSYTHSTTNSSLAALGFTPINRDKEHNHGIQLDQDRRASATSIKMEPPLCDGVDNGQGIDGKQSNFTVNTLWDSRTPKTSIDLHEEFEGESLDM